MPGRNKRPEVWDPKAGELVIKPMLVDVDDLGAGPVSAAA